MAIKTKNHEFEKHIIKGILTDKNLAKRVFSGNYSDLIFDTPIHQWIFRSSKARFSRSSDLLSFPDLEYLIQTETKDEQERNLKLSILKTLESTIDSLPDSSNRYNFMWDELVNLYLKRQFLDIVDKGIESLSSNPKIDPTQIYKQIERDFHETRKGTNTVLVDTEDIFSQDAIDKRIEKYETEKGKGEYRGLPYFLPKLTEVTGGIKPTDLILFVARQKVGKSITLLNQAVYLTGLGYNVAYVSIEQSKEEITLRADSLSLQLKHVDIKLRKLDEHHEVLYKARLRDLNKKNGKFFVIDIPRGASINLIEKEIKDLLDRGNTINAIIIDYLGLLNSDGDGDKFYFNIGVMARQLKELCRELKIPILTANQMTRGSEKEKVKTASGIAYSDQIGSHVDYCFALSPLGEGKLEIQTVLARDSDAVTIQCLTNYQMMLIFEQKIESIEEDEEDLFG